MKVKSSFLVKFGLCFIVSISLLCGCSGAKESSTEEKSQNEETKKVDDVPKEEIPKDEEPPKDESVSKDEDFLITVDYGTYNVSKKWNELFRNPDGKVFYAVAGADVKTPQSNVSVECIPTEYTPEQSDEFLAAIRYMNNKQLGIPEGETIDHAFGDTEMGNKFIQFMFDYDMEGKNVSSVQYFVMGEKQAVLIYATDFGDGITPSAGEIAEQICQSFVWK